jgi:hypothetical protein
MTTATSSARRWRRSPDSAQCQRCGGLLVTEWHNQLDSMESRCIQCGEVIDPVILSNREYQRADGVGLDSTSATSDRRS